MTSVPDKIAASTLGLLPSPVARRLRTEAGKRFTRFILVAVAAVVASQVMLGLLTGPVNLSAGASGVIASMTGALVSYLLSRWAWERRGRPDVLRETLPFWAVSLAVWAILGLTSHYSSVWAHSMGYTHLRKHLVVQGAYFLMNCVTFVARFLIFHYVLFANKGRPSGVPGGSAARMPSARTAAAAPSAKLAAAEAGGSDTGPMPALTGNSRPGGPQA